MKRILDSPKLMFYKMFEYLLLFKTDKAIKKKECERNLPNSKRS